MPAFLKRSCKLCNASNLTEGIFNFKICKRHYRNRVDLAEGYKPSEVETENLLEKIQEHQLKCSRGKFRMLLPPPNVTGNLHLGHALNATVQDVICRQRKQLGYDVEWIPGVDHAGIATQVVVEKNLRSELGLTKHDLGREEFVKKVWQWKQNKNESIIDDLKKLGCGLDWKKEYFTMDKDRSRAVKAAFIKLFEEELIERRNAVVNWSCALQSAISDIEVETIELKGPTEIAVPGYQKNIRFGVLYDVSYKVLGTDEEIVVSTTRPETMLGDVAVGVNPSDQRYTDFRSRQNVNLWHPILNKEIPLIFDLNIDKNFGTGAMKITPAHDKVDFNIAQNHLLEPVQVFEKDGKICDTFESFKGMPRFEAREKILNDLAELQQLKKTQDHYVNLPICSRSKDVLEYMLLPQWFIKCESLAAEARSAVNSGRLKLVPESFEVEWNRWLSNCHDWCISRQLWWGHRIPAYHAVDKHGKECWVAAYDENEAFAKAKNKLSPKIVKLERDNDVLDTWFSSALLPLSVYGWPDPEYKRSYPLSIMQTGNDILFFWVARMVMLGLKLTGEEPFKKVFLNGIVCDSHGRKMSKSIGNVISPQQVVKGSTRSQLEGEIEKSFATGILTPEEKERSLKGIEQMFPNGIPECGTDALRFTLCSHNIKSRFINFDVSECYANKLFMNKIWQATRYTLLSAEKLKMPLNEIEDMNNVPFGKWDQWILSKLHGTLNKCLKSFNDYSFHTATAAFKQFLYYNLCDVYLETTKANINQSSSPGYVNVATLATCLSWSLQAMSPFTPFISAHLLQYLPDNIQINLNEFSSDKVEREIDTILDICHSVRQFKGRMNVTRRHNPQLILYTKKQVMYKLLKSQLKEIKCLTQCEDVEVIEPNTTMNENAQLQVTTSPLCQFELKISNPLLLSKDIAPEAKNVHVKKLLKLEKELDRYRKRCESEGFRQGASEAVQKQHLAKIEKLENQIKTIKALLVLTTH